MKRKKIVKDADFYFFKGEEHRIKEEFMQAIESYEKAIELDPKVADYYYYLGIAQYYIDEYVFHTKKRYGRGYVAYSVLADLVKDGWRPPEKAE